MIGECEGDKRRSIPAGVRSLVNVHLCSTAAPPSPAAAPATTTARRGWLRVLLGVCAGRCDEDMCSRVCRKDFVRAQFATKECC